LHVFSSVSGPHPTRHLAGLLNSAASLEIKIRNSSPSGRAHSSSTYSSSGMYLVSIQGINYCKEISFSVMGFLFSKILINSRYGIAFRLIGKSNSIL
jgi:hypothetical protein